MPLGGRHNLFVRATSRQRLRSASEPQETETGRCDGANSGARGNRGSPISANQSTNQRPENFSGLFRGCYPGDSIGAAVTRVTGAASIPPD
jgi:hypothetical protein